MPLLSNRSVRSKEFAEGKFIARVLREEGQHIKEAQEKKMIGFSGDTFGGRSFTVHGTELDYQHKAVHRLIDIRTRKQADGSKKKKKSHAIHNRPIYGIFNNIIRRISFGFTESVRQELMKLDGTEM